MQNRRDQAQAQSYLLGRVTGALVAGEPDGLETPHRRTLTGLGIGTLIAVLIAAGFAVYGLVVPGGATAWRTSGALIVEKETGTRYLYLDGRLRPVLNYASARLLLGTDIALVTVSATSLAGTPHGTPVGIAGAPDGLPTRGLAGAWWTVCATGGTLAVTGKPAGPAAGADEAIVARAAGAVFLVLNGRRHRLGNDWIVRVLGFSGAEVTVPAAWLDLVPAGADLAPVEVPGRGGRGPEVDGAPSRIGQLFTSDRGGYVLTRSGLSPLTPLAYTLLAADPRTARLYTGGVVAAVALSPAALARLPVVTTLVPEG
ncbi:MAG TPA: type VII secretion protein EccB, partial [Actinoplanes sp.]|nr:type VII secretion protein EccB [Actinoplanes sp.]